ncbi:MAG: hypothetical protein ACRDNW_18435 [Trebonia sp.]
MSEPTGAPRPGRQQRRPRNKGIPQAEGHSGGHRSSHQTRVCPS